MKQNTKSSRNNVQLSGTLKKKLCFILSHRLTNENSLFPNHSEDVKASLKNAQLTYLFVPNRQYEYL